MPYQYGMQNSPSGGNGLGGLPKKQTTPKTVNFTRIVTAGSGVIVPPANAKYMRVAVVGAGGSSVNQYGAGGGACAASKIVPAAPITYNVGAANTSVSPYDGGASTASFPGYSLVANGGGGRTGSTGAAGGAAGLTGDYNFRGGPSNTGTGTGGGGAAGPNGNGGTGSLAYDGVSDRVGFDGSFSGTGWGPGGGAGGNNRGAFPNGLPGAGSGSSAVGTLLFAGSAPAVSPSFFGLPYTAVNSSDGGVMGGGAGGSGSGTVAGGVGGIVVEWFYD
jgi:hypothetical protein